MSRGISIIIPTYNRARLLRATLESLSRLEIPAGVTAELLVINNNCTDDTSEVVAAASSPVPLREVRETGQGLGHARNRALAEAAFEHAVLFDDDVQIAPRWIEGYFEAVTALSADCVVGPVAPLFEVPVPAYATQHTLDGITSAYTRKGDAMRLLPAESAHEVPGCNFGVLKRAAVEVGRFSPDLGRKEDGLVGGEDFEFGWRLVKAGKRVAYQPSCAVNHIITAEKLSKPYLRRRWYGMGVTRWLLDRHAGSAYTPARRVRGLFGLAGMAARCAWMKVAGRPDLAFERELYLLEALGYYLGR